MCDLLVCLYCLMVCFSCLMDEAIVDFCRSVWWLPHLLCVLVVGHLGAATHICKLHLERVHGVCTADILGNNLQQEQCAGTSCTSEAPPVPFPQATFHAPAPAPTTSSILADDENHCRN